MSFRTEAAGAVLWVGAAATAAWTVGWTAMVVLKLLSISDDPDDGHGVLWWAHGAIVAAGTAASVACALGYRRWRRANPLPDPVTRRGPALWLLLAGTAGHAVGGAMMLPFAIWPALSGFSMLGGDGAPGGLAFSLLAYFLVVTVAVAFPALSVLALLRVRRQPTVAAGLAFACIPLLPWGLLHLAAALLLRQEQAKS